MNCKKCNKELNYGTKFCNACGCEAPPHAYDDIYNHTVWGYADKFLNWYNKITLKKITDNIFFKIAVLLVVICIGVFNAYSSYASIRLLPSESYEIKHDKNLGMYYIITPDEQVNINMYIPKGAEIVTVTGSLDGEDFLEEELYPEEYTKGITATKNEFDYINVKAIKNDKITDSIILVVQ